MDQSDSTTGILSSNLRVGGQKFGSLVWRVWLLYKPWTLRSVIFSEPRVVWGARKRSDDLTIEFWRVCCSKERLDHIVRLSARLSAFCSNSMWLKDCLSHMYNATVNPCLSTDRTEVAHDTKRHTRATATRLKWSYRPLSSCLSDVYLKKIHPLVRLGASVRIVMSDEAN